MVEILRENKAQPPPNARRKTPAKRAEARLAALSPTFPLLPSTTLGLRRLPSPDKGVPSMHGRGQMVSFLMNAATGAPLWNVECRDRRECKISPGTLTCRRMYCQTLLMRLPKKDSKRFSYKRRRGIYATRAPPPLSEPAGAVPAAG